MIVYLEQKMQHIISFNDKQSKRTHWVSLFIEKNAGVYFDSFRIEYITQEVIEDESITHNVFRIQSDDSIMCGFYCITFIEYMIAGKTLLDFYTNLFSPKKCKKNKKII